MLLTREIEWKDAEARQRDADRTFLRDQVDRLMTAFYIVNGTVVGFIVLETFFRPRPSPIITENVVLALIAASAAHLAASSMPSARGCSTRGAVPLRPIRSRPALRRHGASSQSGPFGG